MKILADASSLRRPAAGTQRWVTGILGSLGERSEELVVDLGPTRLHGGLAWRLPNLARQRWWYEAGILRHARRVGASVLLMPANLSARRSRLPQVVTILDVNFLTAPGTYERTFVRYATWAWRRSLRDADRVTTLSEFTRAEICYHLGADPERIDVVYPGVGRPAPAGPSPAFHDRPYALFVGATERHKNLSALLEAWSRPKPPADLDLVIVGRPGRAHDDVVTGAARLGDRVEVVGAATDAELERWYRDARVLLIPSLAEGFGYPPLEAMQRRVPVIASTGGSLPEVLGDAALFHGPGDIDALVAGIETAAADGPAREALVAKGSARAARFTWDASGAAMERILEEAAGRGR